MSKHEIVKWKHWASKHTLINLMIYFLELYKPDKNSMIPLSTDEEDEMSSHEKIENTEEEQEKKKQRLA